MPTRRQQAAAARQATPKKTDIGEASVQPGRPRHPLSHLCASAQARLHFDKDWSWSEAGKVWKCETYRSSF